MTDGSHNVSFIEFTNNMPVAFIMADATIIKETFNPQTIMGNLLNLKNEDTYLHLWATYD